MLYVAVGLIIHETVMSICAPTLGLKQSTSTYLGICIYQPRMYPHTSYLYMYFDPISPTLIFVLLIRKIYQLVHCLLVAVWFFIRSPWSVMWFIPLRAKRVWKVGSPSSNPSVRETIYIFSLLCWVRILVPCYIPKHTFLQVKWTSTLFACLFHNRCSFKWLGSFIPNPNQDMKASDN